TIGNAALLVAISAVVACNADDHAARIHPTSLASQSAGKSDDTPTLLARAISPPNAYQQGPISGTLIAGDNGIVPPFPGQPIPGFSAVLALTDGTFWAMPDNGYGAKGNSSDFLLRLYRVRPDFRTADGGSGTIAVVGFIQLRDPDK